MTKFKLCKYCKERHLADRKVFSSTSICGDCDERRTKFIKDVREGLEEAFMFSLGEDPCAFNMSRRFELALVGIGVRS